MSLTLALYYTRSILYIHGLQQQQHTARYATPKPHFDHAEIRLFSLHRQNSSTVLYSASNRLMAGKMRFHHAGSQIDIFFFSCSSLFETFSLC